MSNDVNYDYVPKWRATGTRLIVKIEKPKNLMIGNFEVDAVTGQTASGLSIVDSQGKNKAKEESKIQMVGQMEVEVVSIGSCAFGREGLNDMAEGGDNYVQVGTKVCIEQFSGKPILDEFGRKTLYYHINEHQVLGVME